MHLVRREKSHFHYFYFLTSASKPLGVCFVLSLFSEVVLSLKIDTKVHENSIFYVAWRRHCAAALYLRRGVIQRLYLKALVVVGAVLAMWYPSSTARANQTMNRCRGREHLGHNAHNPLHSRTKHKDVLQNIRCCQYWILNSWEPQELVKTWDQSCPAAMRHCVYCCAHTL